MPSLDVAGVDIIPSNVVRNLGVSLDNKLNMKQHINNTCRAAAFGISKMGKLRKYLNKQSTEVSSIWLPIISRIQFKIILFVFKIKHDLAPSYLSDLLQPTIPARSLRSSRQSHLQFAPGPRTFTRYGDRAFSGAAPNFGTVYP